MQAMIPEIRVFSPAKDPTLDTLDSNNMVVERRDLFVNGGVIQPDELEGRSVDSKIADIFDMRMRNLSNFPLSSSAYKLHLKSRNNIVTRAKGSVTSSPSKSLNLLRKTLQKSINQEFDEVIQRYLKKFFAPAIDNIKRNHGQAAVSDYDVQAVCRNMLDDAKKMYFIGNSLQQRSTRSPFYEALSDGDSNGSFIPSSKKRNRHINGNVPSDNESDGENGSRSKQATHKKKRRNTLGENGKGDNVVRSGPRWDPERLTTETKFVLGSKANKALGFGLTRGRLYTKHPDLFRYIGDFDDRQWLSERNLMPPAGGKAYLLVKQDIEDLLNSEEYLNVPGVNPQDMGEGFCVPQFMIEKMKTKMKTEIEGSRRSPPSRPDSAMSSRPPSAASKRDDDEDYVEEEDLSKTFINATDVSPSGASPSSSSRPYSPAIENI